MTSAIAPAKTLVGTYLAKLLVGNDEPGAPILHLDLLVDAVTGRIVGHGQITQAIAPPNGTIKLNNITGKLREVTLPPENRLVSLKGSYTDPPAAIVLGFSATLAVDGENWTGRASFTYGPHVVTDVPVRSR